ncbi:MAG: penicillin-binding protein activator [Deltaproteobacteria bacterium]|nr:penicillin-binding protein activator [Deltaproteobacteria bacterium]
MIPCPRGILRAIPTLAVGIAFFLAGCEPRVAIKPVEKQAVAPEDAFSLGESYWRMGAYDQALAAYGLFVQQHPESRNAPVALHRIADIQSAQGEYKQSLDTLERIMNEYPGYPESPVVHYQAVELLNGIGAFKRSADEAKKWMDAYSGHSLTGDLLVVLGEDLLVVGDRPGAFLWWLKAEAEGLVSPDRASQLRENLSELVLTSDMETLEAMAGYAVDTEYAPPIYHRIALLRLEEGDRAGAREAAATLVRSTDDPDWLSRGEELLSRIKALTSVRKGTIGCLLPLTGPFAIYGQEVLNGIQLGMGMWRDANEGAELELVVRDTRGELEYALVGLEELVRYEKVMAVIGPLSSKAANPVAARAQALGIPIITLTQKPGITRVGDMVFRNFLTPSREIQRLLGAAVEGLGIRRFGILYPDNSYGRFLTHLFWDGVDERGAKVTAVESYPPDATDFEEQIRKMVGLHYPRPAWVDEKLRQMESLTEEEANLVGAELDANPDEKEPDPEEPEPIVDFEAVFLPDNFHGVAMMAPQLVYHDVLQVQLLGTSLWQSPELVELAGDYIQGAIFPSGFFADSGDRKVTAFIEEYETNFNDVPGILAASGYDTLLLLKRALSDPTCLTRRDLRDGLMSFQDFSGITGDISFDEEGEVRKSPLLLVISGRRMKVFQDDGLAVEK